MADRHVDGCTLYCLYLDETLRIEYDRQRENVPCGTQVSIVHNTPSRKEVAARSWNRVQLPCPYISWPIPIDVVELSVHVLSVVFASMASVCCCRTSCW
jgi:hypothetical protein